MQDSESQEAGDAELSQQWLGYELHDGLLQWIVGARMHLDAAVSDCTDPELRRKLTQSKRYVELAIEEGRDLIRFLDNQSFELSRDFASLMRRFLRSIQALVDQSDQTLELLQPDPAWPELPQATLWNLLRITQQATRNAIQHAGPASIRIQMGWEDSQHMKLVISDDGLGFDPANASTSGSQLNFGLASMRHRAALINAELNLEAAPGNGCCISLVLPR